MFETIMVAGISVLGSAILAIIAYGIKLGTRMSVQEALFHEKSKSVAALDLTSGLHSNRLTAVESVVPELRRLIESLRDVPSILVSLKDMVENDRERTRDLEYRINTTLQGVQGVQGVQGQRGIQAPGEHSSS